MKRLPLGPRCHDLTSRRGHIMQDAARGQRRTLSASTSNPSSPSSHSSILYLNASSGPQSLTALTAQRFIDSFLSRRANCAVDEVDLWDEQLLQFNLSHVGSQMRRLAGKGLPSDEDNLQPVQRMASQLLSADVLLVASPIWNFSCPYVLKQYIDCVIQPGLTIKDSDDGIQPLGDAGKPLVLVLGAGGSGRRPSRDHMVPYLTDIFGVVGFNHLKLVLMSNTANRIREEVLAESYLLAEEAAEEIASDINRSCSGESCLKGVSATPILQGLH